MPPTGVFLRLCRPDRTRASTRGAGDRGAVRRGPQTARPPAGDDCAQVAAIAVYHRSIGHPTPTAHDWSGQSCAAPAGQLGVAQPQKTALDLNALCAVVRGIPDDLRGWRDRALLLISWTAALRRSELVALQVADLSFEPEGVVLTIRRLKADREGAGASMAVPLGGEEATCPVPALRRWLEAAVVDEGHIFRRIDRYGNLGTTLSDRTLAEIEAARAAAADLEGNFASHSLRAGFATAAAQAGRSEAAIMHHGRWRSVQIAHRYIRQGAR